MEIDLFYYLFLSFILFFIGICGMAFNRNNILRILMSLQIITLASLINLVSFGAFLKDSAGEAFSIIIIIITSCEFILALAICNAYFHKNKNIETDKMDKLKD